MGFGGFLGFLGEISPILLDRGFGQRFSSGCELGVGAFAVQFFEGRHRSIEVSDFISVTGVSV